jgi:hypothetical protein
MDNLELLLKDFGEYSQKMLNIKAKGDKVGDEEWEKQLSYHFATMDLDLFPEEKLVWWGGKEGFMPEVSIGKPGDYLPIREDYGKLKEFIGGTLDRGKVHAGGGTHGDTSRETDTSDYVVWLHRRNSNKTFKANLEKAVTEILQVEFGRKFKPVDTTPSLAEGRERIQRWYKGDVDNWLHSMLRNEHYESALWRLGLNVNVSDEDLPITQKFEKEAKTTERLITLEEVLKTYGGSKESLTDSFKQGHFSNVRVLHPEEMSAGFKKELLEWHTQKVAFSDAVRKYSPQFNRLTGLLEVISQLGGQGVFKDVYAQLKQQAEHKFMIDSPPVKFDYSSIDVYRSILIALSAVQKGKELEQFWLDNIKKCPGPERVIASINGLLTMHKTQSARAELLPEMLGALRERGNDTDKLYQNFVLNGFYRDENMLEDITNHVASLCGFRGQFRHLGKKNCNLDILSGTDIQGHSRAFTFMRYSPEGIFNLEAVLELATGKILGSQELADTINAYINETGYQVNGKLAVTSLEGRQILGNDSKTAISENGGLNGWYEGIIGLNYTRFPFVYNPTDGTLLVAKPNDSVNLMFGHKKGWAERRTGFDKIKSTELNSFKPSTELGNMFNDLVAAKRKERLMGDAVYTLEKSFDHNTPKYLSDIISDVLVARKDGLSA